MERYFDNISDYITSSDCKTERIALQEIEDLHHRQKLCAHTFEYVQASRRQGWSAEQWATEGGCKFGKDIYLI